MQNPREGSGELVLAIPLIFRILAFFSSYDIVRKGLEIRIPEVIRISKSPRSLLRLCLSYMDIIYVQETSPQGTPFDDTSCEPMSQNSSSLQTLGTGWQAWRSWWFIWERLRPLFFFQNFILRVWVFYSTLPLNPGMKLQHEDLKISKSHEAKIQMTIQQAGQVELAFAHKGMSTPRDEPWNAERHRTMLKWNIWRMPCRGERFLINKNMTRTWSRNCLFI